MIQPLRYKRSHLVLLSLTAVLLAACGGTGTGDTTAAANGNDRVVAANGAASGAAGLVEVAKTLRGTVLNMGAAQTLTKSDIDKSVSVAEAPLVTGIPGATSAAGNAKCDVQVVKFTYSTIKPQDGPKAVQATVVASAALLVPVPGPDCAKPWPLLSHQHGTSIGAGSVGADGIKSMAAYFGSQGYVVVMPDYHGYGNSTLDYHPYLQAEPSAAVVIDAVRAARNWLHDNGYDTSMGSKLFLAGTSEGGYVTLATQRSMERYFPNEFTITASASTSGPYQVQATFDGFMSQTDTPEESKTVGATFILEGLQQTYGDIYADPKEIYNDPWYAGMNKTPRLLPNAETSSDTVLRKTCQLPFNLKDPATDETPRYAGCKDTALLTEDFVTTYANNTGGGARVRAHAKSNNLLQNWTPSSPSFVCYGNLDAMATPNALAAQKYFKTHGVAQLMTVEDVQTETQEPIAHWMATQTPLHPPGAGYHGQVEAPACTSWTRHAVFDTLR